MDLSPEDLDELAAACDLLNRPSLAIRLANKVGMPLERMMSRLPAKALDVVHRAASAAIGQALEMAVSSLHPQRRATPSNLLHKLGCGLSGGVGGFFGVAALTLELPVSTTIMMRSIADIARSYGEDLRLPATRVACLEVFAFGGLSRGDDSFEAGYYAVRAALAAAVREAAEYLTGRGLAEAGAPVLARLISQIATRFGAVVSEKVAAQAVPVLGAAGGAAINVVFIGHFQSMARAHFTIRRLERVYGVEPVRREFDRLCPQDA